jgi:endoglucanase
MGVRGEQGIVGAESERAGGAWFGVASIALVVAISSLTVALTTPGGRPDHPIAGRTLYVDPASSAAEAAAAATDPEQREAFELLADIPTGIWLLPEALPAAEVTGYVDGVQGDAAAKAAVPIFVVYGIPSRDCGQFSAGGLDAQGYPEWIAAIAEGIGGREALVVLEPDALALAPECGTEEQATAFIREAVGILSAEGTTIYLDGGHSNWLPADTMAQLLQRAGVDQVRGFVTNVSNYNATDAERAYGERLSALLGGAHFAIDTSRNGNGSNGEWCNPAGRAIGDTPTGVDDGTALDGTLWVKNPGESDGTCNGGPPAGDWWPEAALSLVHGGR